MKHFTHIVETLEANGLIFQQLFSSAPEEMIYWRPAPDKWNLLEIACHMRDEEVDDFRRRVQQTLEQPEVAPPAINPEGWVTARSYETETFDGVMQSFGDARKASIAYLRSLVAPQWENAWQHPQLGPLSAGRFLHNWLAHDYLHIRQITALKFAYLKAISGEDLSYAGEW